MSTGFSAVFSISIERGQNVVIKQNGEERKRVISRQIDQWLFVIHPKNEPNNCRLFELGKGNMMKLVAPFLMIFCSLVFARDVTPIPAEIDPNIQVAAIPMYVEEAVEIVRTDLDNMPILNVQSTINSDFVLHEFVEGDEGKIIRHIIVYDKVDSTIEFLIYPPMDMSWETYMLLSTGEKEALLNINFDNSPTHYVSNVEAGVSYKTTKMQLFGLLTQFENILGASNDSTILMRSLASLMSKKEEVQLELGELRKMLKATSVCK